MFVLPYDDLLQNANYMLLLFDILQSVRIVAAFYASVIAR